MASVNHTVQITHLTDDELRDMVGPDPVRPGPTRFRVLTEDVPIWPIIGDLLAQGWNPDSTIDQSDIVRAVTSDWDLSLDTIAAAILYYREHRCAIDTLLAENEAARR